jgi:predicted Zn-dependent protease
LCADAITVADDAITVRDGTPPPPKPTTQSTGHVIAFNFKSVEHIERHAAQVFIDAKSKATADGVLFSSDTSLVRQLGSTMARLKKNSVTYNARVPQWTWELTVIDVPRVSARCLPGGKIIVYNGLINVLVPTPAELAFVLAHEIAHALREHGYHRHNNGVFVELSTYPLWAMPLAMPSSILHSSITAKMVISTVMPGVFEIRYDHRAEFDADHVGLMLMANAGYDPHSAITLLRKLDVVKQQRGTSGGSWTHPSIDDRIRQIDALLPRAIELYLVATKK